MRRHVFYFLLPAVVAFSSSVAQDSAARHTLRPPAVPLLVHDPYFSIWSPADSLSGDWPRHWTGTTHGMTAMIRVDGRVYRVMGKSPSGIPGFPQRSLSVLPTRTVYGFEGGGVRLSLTFLSPMIPDEIDLLSKPLTYMFWDVEALDGLVHDVSVYFDISGEAVVNTAGQKITWGRYALGEIDVMRMGSLEQPVLEKVGDDLRIDWGHLYVAAKREPGSSIVITSDELARKAFAERGLLPSSDDLRSPRPANDEWPVMAHAHHFGKVSGGQQSHAIVIAYDDEFSIQYFQRNLRPYWRRNGDGAHSLLAGAFQNPAAMAARCRAFDEGVMGDCARVGGDSYAAVASLAYRQCLAANKIVADLDGTMLMFPKENFSNGCIGTVDVIYPASPLFLLFSPALLKAQLTPLLEYARLPRWKFPFAPHDLGTYPHANGQVYGGREQTETDQMPVEESGNMLLMVAGIAVAEGNASFAARYWSVLSRWAEYLKEKGLDPENQLCTDDFAGHLAHNVNLSAKAILALGAHAKLCAMLGKKDEASTFRKLADSYAARWQTMADDGDHSRLAFDKPGTWSQKYNLIWDRLLDLHIFPVEVARKEVAYYLTRQNAFGLPLDNRKAYTKLDWVVWSASLAESKKDFEALLDPVLRFVNSTPDRVPLTDWYWTTDAKKVGFQARSVVGGVFVKLLMDAEVSRKWRGRL
jgi:hypothetical protein